MQSHGYDNLLTSMQAIFFTRGPFSNAVTAARQMRISPFAHLMHSLLPQWCTDITNSDPHIIDTFINVELYGLVMKMLDLEEHAASTNATWGFWDNYL